jgi:2-hydroxychromene-2-carboxylate isomerase
MPAPDVVFHFDPICPWTWMTSRWLTEVGAARPLALGWEPLSLRVVNEIEPGRYAPLDASADALRVVAALADAGEHEAASRFYTALGEQVHRRQRGIDAEVVAEVVAASDLPATAVVALDDPGWDAIVAERTERAVEAAGGGVGSPIISWPGSGRAVSGPIVSPPPTGADALRLWDVVTAALEVPGFSELKRGRSGQSPQIP